MQNHSFTRVCTYPTNGPKNPVFFPISPTRILTIGLAIQAVEMGMEYTPPRISSEE